MKKNTKKDGSNPVSRGLGGCGCLVLVVTCILTLLFYLPRCGSNIMTAAELKLQEMEELKSPAKSRPGKPWVQDVKPGDKFIVDTEKRNFAYEVNQRCTVHLTGEEGEATLQYPGGKSKAEYNINSRQVTKCTFIAEDHPLKVTFWFDE